MWLIKGNECPLVVVDDEEDRVGCQAMRRWVSVSQRTAKQVFKIEFA
jgi:hypothetical protein